MVTQLARFCDLRHAPVSEIDDIIEGATPTTFLCSIPQSGLAVTISEW